MRKLFLLLSLLCLSSQSFASEALFHPDPNPGEFDARVVAAVRHVSPFNDAPLSLEYQEMGIPLLHLLTAGNTATGGQYIPIHKGTKDKDKGGFYIHDQSRNCHCFVRVMDGALTFNFEAADVASGKPIEHSEDAWGEAPDAFEEYLKGSTATRHGTRTVTTTTQFRTPWGHMYETVSAPMHYLLAEFTGKLDVYKLTPEKLGGGLVGCIRNEGGGRQVVGFNWKRRYNKVVLLASMGDEGPKQEQLILDKSHMRSSDDQDDMGVDVARTMAAFNLSRTGLGFIENPHLLKVTAVKDDRREAARRELKQVSGDLASLVHG